MTNDKFVVREEARIDLKTGKVKRIKWPDATYGLSFEKYNEMLCGDVTKDYMDIWQKEAKTKLNINQNKISGVYVEKQYYFTNLLTISKTFYDFVTSKFVLETCERYLGNSFRLKALRYYETYGGHHMQWHTDNKTDKDFTHNIPGLIFIFSI